MSQSVGPSSPCYFWHYSRHRLGRCLGLSILCWLGLNSVDSLALEAVANEPQPVDSASRLERLRQGIPGRTPEGIAGEETLQERSEPMSEPITDTNPAPVIDAAAASTLRDAAAQAAQAEILAQMATSAADWDAVMVQWLSAIALAQSITPQSPSRVLAQRQLRSYVQRLQEVQQRTEQASPQSQLPSLGSELLDAQLAGYLSYVATFGVPDILIVGSSRALQGIDPQVLQAQLAAQGYADLKVFNFSVNGATAQVVNFVVSELLPQPAPAIIVWGDGSRAFNEGRRDLTWESLLASPGYQALQTRASLVSSRAESSGQTSNRAEVTVAASNPVVLSSASVRVTDDTPLLDVPGNLNGMGFSAVRDRFSPQTYYQQFPKVRGRYDGAYTPFTLNGSQTTALQQLASHAAGQSTQLVFVNLPLSGSYLDADRRYYEAQFQQFLRSQSTAHGFEVIDLLTQWQDQPELFADPSHINQDGAAAIAKQLAQNSTIRTAL
ncbi:MAG: hypothetical protein AAF050_16670 [Cyanobacteria bacterium J06649_5]